MMPILGAPHAKYIVTIMSDGAVAMEHVGHDTLSDEALLDMQRILANVSVMQRAWCVHGVSTKAQCTECAAVKTAMSSPAVKDAADDVDWSTPLTPERMAYLHDKHHGPAVADASTQSTYPADVSKNSAEMDTTEDRAILDVYDKLHADKLGMHWLWAVIQQVAAGGDVDAALREFGYTRAPMVEPEHVPGAGKMVANAAAAVCKHWYGNACSDHVKLDELIGKLDAALRGVQPVTDHHELPDDAAMLDWLERKLFGSAWGGTIGHPKDWRVLGDYRHTTQRMVGNTFREAIRAAMKAATP